MHYSPSDSSRCFTRVYYEMFYAMRFPYSILHCLPWKIVLLTMKQAPYPQIPGLPAANKPSFTQQRAVPGPWGAPPCTLSPCGPHLGAGRGLRGLDCSGSRKWGEVRLKIASVPSSHGCPPPPPAPQSTEDRLCLALLQPQTPSCCILSGSVGVGISLGVSNYRGLMS